MPVAPGSTASPAIRAGTDEAMGTIQTAEEAVAAARGYAESVAGGVIERDRSGRVPAGELAALDASGLLAITVPRAYGGPELGAPVLAEVIRVIAAVDPAIAQVPQAHFLFADVLAVRGTPGQRERLFAEIVDGGRFGNAQAERGGQHAQDLKTRLDRDAAGDLRLNGTKYYTTGSLTARWIGVTALDEAGQLVLVFVRRDTPGVTLDTDWNVMGQRATVSGAVFFADVLADPALVVPYAGAFEVPQQLGARTQLVHAAIQTGIAGGALRDAGWFVREKARPFFEAARAGLAGTASTDPHTIYRYGELATKVSAADERYDLSRHWRNARTHASHDPVSWKYHHIGNNLLNDVLPPNHGQL
jgi:alkylation response protein AidB-like acyl-CoA dehydrogenase